MTISRAPAAARRSTARAISERGNGHWRSRSENVTSSTATTADVAGRLRLALLEERGRAPRSRSGPSAPVNVPAPATAAASTPAVSSIRSRGTPGARPHRFARYARPARTTTVRPVRRSLTATAPSRTRVTVPSQRSRVTQAVPRAVATLLLP